PSRQILPPLCRPYSVISQIRTFPLALPEAVVLPSGESATDQTSSLGLARNVARTVPVARSHTLTSPARPPETKTLPSREIAIELTPATCPLSIDLCLPVTASCNQRESPAEAI